MTSALAWFARHRPLLSRLSLLFGILLAITVWVELTITGGYPVDARAYWSANPNELYPHPELLQHNGYNYSPAFEFVVGWGRLLPFEAFVAIWRALILVALVWLAGPLTPFVLFLPPVATEINAANIQVFLAAAIVLGFRYPSTWAFVLLTKVSPGVGLLWFALRREWRKLGVALVVTALVVLIALVLWPQRWAEYTLLLTAGTPPPVPPYNLSIWVRLPFAIAFVVLGAWKGWRWPVVVGGTLALPLFFFLSPSMLVGTLPYLRQAVGRRLAAVASPTQLRPQATPESGAILAG